MEVVAVARIKNENLANRLPVCAAITLNLKGCLNVRLYENLTCSHSDRFFFFAEVDMFFQPTAVSEFKVSILQSAHSKVSYVITPHEGLSDWKCPYSGSTSI